jgi:hypothetical protein
MEPWTEVELESARGGTVKVTAVHAQHGPDGSDEVQGPVLGFLLSAPGAEAIYVSGDNASRDVVRALVQKTGELASGNGIADRLLMLERGQRAEV